MTVKTWPGCHTDDLVEGVSPKTDIVKISSKRDELARTIAYANSLGVRADVCGDAAQKAEAERIYRDAKDELERLQVPNAPVKGRD